MAELVLVTGGSGYIAGWCIAELLRRGYDVRTTVRDPGREKAVVDAVSTVADPAGRLSFAVADLTADDGWDVAVKGVDRSHEYSHAPARSLASLVPTPRINERAARYGIFVCKAYFIERIITSASADSPKCRSRPDGSGRYHRASLLPPS